MSAGLTLEHVLDKDAALNDLLVGVELLVVGGDEENHFLTIKGIEKEEG